MSPPLYALPLLLSKNICGRGVSRAHAEFICAVHTPPPRYVLRSAGNHNRTAARGESGERRLCDDVQVALSAISVAGVSVRRGEVGGLQMQLNFLLLREGRVALAKDAWLGGAGGGVIARVQGSEVQLTPAFVPLRCRRRKTTALPENAHGNAVTTVILP